MLGIPRRFSHFVFAFIQCVAYAGRIRTPLPPRTSVLVAGFRRRCGMSGAVASLGTMSAFGKT